MEEHTSAAFKFREPIQYLTLAFTLSVIILALVVNFRLRNAIPKERIWLQTLRFSHLGSQIFYVFIFYLPLNVYLRWFSHCLLFATLMISVEVSLEYLVMFSKTGKMIEEQTIRKIQLAFLIIYLVTGVGQFSLVFYLDRPVPADWARIVSQIAKNSINM